MNQLRQVIPEVKSYIDITRHIQLLILSGFYHPGEKIPSIRKMALEYGVSNNTASRGIMEVERIGLIQSHRTSGKTVITDRCVLQNAKDLYIKEQVKLLKTSLCSLGCTQKEIIQLISDIMT